ncbi:MAG: hypothetical protein JXB47_03095 [Anaerolineae bacterium]|nr:hypothetical protein [Anaerolineae bacterium]
MAALPATTIQEKLAEHAARLGEDVSRVRAADLDGFHMREAGTFLDLDLHGFTMFTVRADQLDLGIPRADLRGKYITRGTKHLVPKEYIKRLTNLGNRFRTSLERNSFNVTGPWRWVPFTAYARWKEEWAELDAELTALKAEILADYDAIKVRLAEIYAQIGAEAWQAHLARAGADDLDASLRDRDRYVARVVESALARLPTPGDIEHGIYATYYNARMLSLADVEADRLLQARREAERYEEEARAARADEFAQAQRRLVRAGEEAQRRLFFAEAEEKELEVRERRIQLQAMHDAEMEHARAQIARDGSMYRAIFDQYRAMIYEAASSILAAIEKHGYLPGANARQAQSMREVFAVLNAHGDHEIEQVLEQLDQLVQRRVPNPARGDKATYDTGAMVAALEKITALTVASAQRLAREAGSTRAGALMV